MEDFLILNFELIKALSCKNGGFIGDILIKFLKLGANIVLDVFFFSLDPLLCLKIMLYGVLFSSDSNSPYLEIMKIELKKIP